MGSSGGGSANPAFLSQGGTPMPGIPIAGEGTPKPQEMGAFQEFLPEISPAGQSGYQILPAGGGRNPSATGLTAEMFKYRSPSGILAQGSNSGDTAAASGGGGGSGSGNDINTMRQQLAALQSQVSQSQPQQGNAIWGTGSPLPGGLWSVPPATS